MSENKTYRNRCQFSGRLVKDVEVQSIAEGKDAIFFTIAVNNDYKKGNEWIHDTLFLDCSAFDEKTIKLAGYMKKGKEIVVYGRLKMSEYFSAKYQHNVKKPFLLVGAVDVMLNFNQPADTQQIADIFS